MTGCFFYDTLALDKKNQTKLNQHNLNSIEVVCVWIYGAEKNKNDYIIFSKHLAVFLHFVECRTV